MLKLILKSLIIGCFIAMPIGCCLGQYKTTKTTTTTITVTDTVFIPLSRAGGTIGLQMPDGNMDNGFGISAFLHQTVSRSWFFSVNAAYNYYSMTITEGAVSATSTLTEIPFTFGMNAFVSHKGVRPYLGLEVGIMRQRGSVDGNVGNVSMKNVYTISDWDLLVVPIIGFSLPVSPQISIEFNARMRIVIDDEAFASSVNAGIAYMLP